MAIEERKEGGRVEHWVPCLCGGGSYRRKEKSLCYILEGGSVLKPLLHTGGRECIEAFVTYWREGVYQGEGGRDSPD